MSRIKFFHSETKEKFNSSFEKGTISTNDLVFIDDTKELWTHNKYYGENNITEVDSFSELPTTGMKTNDICIVKAKYRSGTTVYPEKSEFIYYNSKWNYLEGTGKNYDTSYDFTIVTKKNSADESSCYYRLISLPMNSKGCVLNINTTTMYNSTNGLIFINYEGLSSFYSKYYSLGGLMDFYIGGQSTSTFGLYFKQDSANYAPTTVVKIKVLACESNNFNFEVTEDVFTTEERVELIPDYYNTIKDDISYILSASTTETVTSTSGAASITSNDTYIDYVINNSEDDSSTITATASSTLSAGAYRFIFKKKISGFTLVDGSITATYSGTIDASSILTYSTDGNGTYTFSYNSSKIVEGSDVTVFDSTEINKTLNPSELTTKTASDPVVLKSAVKDTIITVEDDAAPTTSTVIVGSDGKIEALTDTTGFVTVKIVNDIITAFNNLVDRVKANEDALDTDI